jgi:tetratricopeptide (TPR) repeat protein
MNHDSKTLLSRLLWALRERGGELYRKGDYAGAEQLFKLALAGLEENASGSAAEQPGLCRAIGGCLVEQNRNEEALPYFKSALASTMRGTEQTEDEELRFTAWLCLAGTQLDAANCYYALGRHAEAEPLFEQALTLDEEHNCVYLEHQRARRGYRLSQLQNYPRLLRELNRADDAAKVEARITARTRSIGQ